MEMDFQREVCERLPLAECVLRLGQFVLNDDLLSGVFHEHRGRSYVKVIDFPLFVRLIGDSLLEHAGNGHQAFTRARESGELETSVQAAYGKLQRIPISLSLGFLVETSARLREVFPAEVESPVAKSLRDFTVINIDGKKLKHLPHRLLPTRKLRGKLLGGKLVVAMDQGTGLTIAMQGVRDGETSDAPLVPGLLAQVRRIVPTRRLYVEDRQFCDLVQPGLLNEGEYFLIRYHPKVSFHRDSSVPVRHGKTAEGKKYQEEWGWLGLPQDPRRCRVRRITLYRPGMEDVIVVTNLLDADGYPATDLLQAYLHRWDIETLFQRVTEVFHLKELISSTPEATVFQAAYCFLLSNLITTIRAYLAVQKKREPETISTYQLQYDVERELNAWNQLLDTESTLAVLEKPLTAARLRQHLRRRLSTTWSDRWLKTSATQHTPVTEKRYIRGGHTSIHRLQIQAKMKKRRC